MQDNQTRQQFQPYLLGTGPCANLKAVKRWAIYMLYAIQWFFAQQFRKCLVFLQPGNFDYDYKIFNFFGFQQHYFDI